MQGSIQDPTQLRCILSFPHSQCCSNHSHALPPASAPQGIPFHCPHSFWGWIGGTLLPAYSPKLNYNSLSGGLIILLFDSTGSEAGSHIYIPHEMQRTAMFYFLQLMIDHPCKSPPAWGARERKANFKRINLWITVVFPFSLLKWLRFSEINAQSLDFLPSPLLLSKMAPGNRAYIIS